MELIEVATPKDVKDFHKVPFIIYKNDPNWIPHLKQDVEAVFDKNKNKFFRHGEATRWILKNDKGELIGRVAAFINKKTAHTYKQPTGGMGFFEVINDKKAAFKLFDACKQWLEERGMEAMDGPINFGEKDKFWGLIIENFTTPPYYGQNYNPKYYVDFFESYGFKIYYKQLIFQRSIDEPLQEKYRERAERIARNPKYRVETIKKNNLEKYAEDFRTVYNRAWVTHESFKGMSKVQAMAIMKQLKPVLDEELIYFVYYEDKPVGFYISLPELNEIFRYVNGNLNLFGKLKFLYHKWKGTCRTSFGVAFGIDPDHQGKGLEGAIFQEMERVLRNAKKRRYDNIIITWIGDFNPKMIRIIEGLGGKPLRIMATYRKLFDENAEFERSPIIGVRKGNNPMEKMR